jgi:hypothetical protein
MIADFEQALDQAEKIIDEMLSDCGINAPPVDVRELGEKKGLSLSENVLEGRRGQNFKFRGRKYVEVDSRDRRVRQNFTLAHEILEVEFESITNNAREKHKLAMLATPFLLMPSKWFNHACATHDFDLIEIKNIFDTASYEAVALRMLHVEPGVITVHDNGKVTNRKTSYDFHIPKKLFPAEQQAISQALETGSKFLAADDAISTTAYPIIEKKFERVILRTLFDEFA